MTIPPTRPTTSTRPASPTVGSTRRPARKTIVDDDASTQGLVLGACQYVLESTPMSEIVDKIRKIVL